MKKTSSNVWKRHGSSEKNCLSLPEILILFGYVRIISKLLSSKILKVEDRPKKFFGFRAIAQESAPVWHRGLELKLQCHGGRNVRPMKQAGSE